MKSLDNLQRYLHADHKTRWQADLISIAIAVCWSSVRALAFSASNEVIFREGTIVLACSMGLFTLLYAATVEDEPRRKKKVRATIIDLQRRSLTPKLKILAYSLGTVALVALSLPKAEAAILDYRLKRAVKTGFTAENIQKATAIVQQAQRYNLRASPTLVSELGLKIIESAEHNSPGASLVSNSAIEFASYRSQLVRPPVPDVVGFITRTPGMDFETFFIGVGKAPQDNVIWESPAVSRPFRANAQRVIEKIERQTGFISLDHSHIRNITFENAVISYNGGPVRLESVECINCKFRSDDPTSPNVRSLIEAFMKGGPTTFEVD